MMDWYIVLFLAALTKSEDAFSNPSLIKDFKDPVSTCNAVSSQRIRTTFHDSGTFSIQDTTPVGADGSLQFELSRAENKGTESSISFYVSMSKKYNISVADAIAFGGKVAVESCIPGVTVAFKSGRIDALKSNPENRLPGVQFKANDILSSFRDRMGFTVPQLVALIGGAHSIAFAGKLDATPTVFDSVFFQEIMNNTNHGIKLPSDLALTEDPEMLSSVKQFASNQGLMIKTFVEAFEICMSLGSTFKQDPSSGPSSNTEDPSTSPSPHTPSKSTPGSVPTQSSGSSNSSPSSSLSINKPVSQETATSSNVIRPTSVPKNRKLRSSSNSARVSPSLIVHLALVLSLFLR